MATGAHQPSTYPFTAGLCDVDPSLSAAGAFSGELIAELRRVTIGMVTTAPDDDVGFMALLEAKLSAMLAVGGVYAPVSGNAWFAQWDQQWAQAHQVFFPGPPNTEPVQRCGYAVSQALQMQWTNPIARIDGRISTAGYGNLTMLGLVPSSRYEVPLDQSREGDNDACGYGSACSTAVAAVLPFSKLPYPPGPPAVVSRRYKGIRRRGLLLRYSTGPSAMEGPSKVEVCFPLGHQFLPRGRSPVRGLAGTSPLAKGGVTWR